MCMFFSHHRCKITLLHGNPLRAGGSKYKDLREGRLALLPGLTAPTQKLLHALMAPDPADRPSAAKVRCLQGLVHRSVNMVQQIICADPTQPTSMIQH